jgi:UDP-glucose 4-epimerase
MHILITGNTGYVGPVLARHLRREFPDATLTGFDTGYFAHCLTGATSLPEHVLTRQLWGDVREPPAGLFEGVDAVIHLAAISNDPMGSRFEAVTDEINRAASLAFASAARDAGVVSFVFASSCSVYGVADGPPRRESDTVSPVTAYARSKIAVEEGLRELDAPNMAVTSLRFATACGMSERLRLDLVLNDFVASALATGVITVLSDGTPWRPLIDVEDMARALTWAALRRVGDGERLTVVNVSRDSANHQVRDLAHAVAAAVPGARVEINTGAPADSRSYKVDFSLFKEIAPDSQPRVDLAGSIAGLEAGLTAMGFADPAFRASPFMRLKVLEQHMAAGRLLPSLRWSL